MDKVDKLVSKVEEYLLSFSVLAMAVVLIAGVIARSVFNSSLTFTEEIGQALNITVTFLGIGYCARQARHISMSVFFDMMNPIGKKILMCAVTLITAIVMGFLTYLSFKYVSSVAGLGRVTPSLRVPMWLTYIPIVLGFGLGTLEFIRTFLKNIRSPKEEVYISSIMKVGENLEEVSEPSEDLVQGGQKK